MDVFKSMYGKAKTCCKVKWINNLKKNLKIEKEEQTKPKVKTDNNKIGIGKT